MKSWLTRLLFDWVYVLFFGLFQGFLNLVSFIESFFDIFAGTARVFYKGNAEFLISIFFGHDAVTNAFWAMALIAIVMAFGFCIVQMARKAADVTDSVKQSVGQIMTSFFRCLLIIIMLNAMTVAAINITNVLLDRINFALKNASVLNQEESDKRFTDEEYATMAKILATVANYSVNPSADSRYNVNSCFNAVRTDLLSLYVNGFFEYDYDLDANGHYTWQGALALLASSADLTTDLNLDTYYADVVNAYQTVSRELSTYREFAPVETAHYSVPDSLDTDVLIFLITGMQAAQNKMYNNGDFNDTIRKGYVNGTKSYNNLKQVRKDFDIWKIDYLVGYISCIVFIIIMAICIFTFIVRMFNLLLLYLTAPLFASTMPLDDGAKWQSWTQAFVIQIFSGFGLVIAMRLYLIIIPIVISRDLVFFAGSGTGVAILNRMAQLLMVLGGAWAVLQSGSVITGILAGNPGMAAIQQEGRIGGMVTGWALRAPMAAIGAAKGIAGIASSPFRAVGGAVSGIKGLQDKHAANQQRKSERLDRKAQQRQNKADKTFEKADKRLSEGKYGGRTQRLMNSAGRQQRSADRASAKANEKAAGYGLRQYQRQPSYQGFGGGSSGHSSDSKDSGSGSVPERAASGTTSDASAASKEAVAAAVHASVGGASSAAPDRSASVPPRSVSAPPRAGGSAPSGGGGTGRSVAPPPRSASVPPRSGSRVVSTGSASGPSTPTSSSSAPPSRSVSAPPPGSGGGTPPRSSSVPPRGSSWTVSTESSSGSGTPPPPPPRSSSTPPPRSGSTPPRNRGGQGDGDAPPRRRQ